MNQRVRWLGGFLCLLTIVGSIVWLDSTPVRGFTKPLEDAVIANEVKPIGAPYAVSDSTNLSLILSLAELQNLPKDLTNWPKRSEGCGLPSEWPSSSAYKTLPVVPDAAGLYERRVATYAQLDIWLNDLRISQTEKDNIKYGRLSGRFRPMVGKCQKSNQGSYPGIAQLLDAGTGTDPAWSTFPGQNKGGWSLSPVLFNGWASNGGFFPGSDWKPAVVTERTRAPNVNTRKATCLWYGSPNSDRTAQSAWLDPMYSGSPLRTQPMDSSAKAIWGSNCKDDTDYHPSIYESNGYDSPSYSYEDLNRKLFYINPLYSSGTTIFRKVFTLTQDDMDKIIAAESRNGGLGLDILADDWFTAYINGEMLSTHAYAVSPTRYIRVRSDTLQVGNNVLAIQVDDKIVTHGDIASIGQGLIYQLRLFDDPLAASNYTLVPKVSSNGMAIVVPGDTVNFSYTVDKTGVNSNMTSVGIRQIIIPPGATFPTGFVARKNADCSTYTSGSTGGVTCSTLSRPSQNFTVPTTNLTDETVPTGSLTAGTQICRVLFVDSYNQAPAPNNSHSAVVCVLIARSPTAAIVGSDASAGGDSVAPFNKQSGFLGSNAAASTYGSFGEYALLATGRINGFSSSALMGGLGRNLMFANYGLSSPSDGGFYRDNHVISDYAARYGAIVPSSSPIFPSSGALPTGGGVTYYRAAGPITITQSTGITGRVIIYAPGQTVTIAGNITYNGVGLTSFGAAPQVVIIADNVRVSGNVDNIDGLLVVKNVFTSCSEAGDKAAPTTSAMVAGGQCDRKLTVNGAVIAGDVYLGRSAATPNSPAEVFRFRPEVFLTPYEAGKTDFTLVTKSEIELPPRN